MIKSLLLLSLISPFGHATSKDFVVNLKHKNLYHEHESFTQKVFTLKIKSLIDSIDKNILRLCFEKKYHKKSSIKGSKCRSKLKKVTEQYLFCRKFKKILKLYGVFLIPESDNEIEVEDLDFEKLTDFIDDDLFYY